MGETPASEVKIGQVIYPSTWPSGNNQSLVKIAGIDSNVIGKGVFDPNLEPFLHRAGAQDRDDRKQAA